MIRLIHRRPQAGWRDERGAVFIEAFISIIFILYMGLLVAQMFMVFHASMAAKSAAMRAARAVALDPHLDPDAGLGPYTAQRARYIASLVWAPTPGCSPAGNEVVCNATVKVPTFLPGGALFFGEGIRGPIEVTETGRFPIIKSTGS